MKQTLWACGPDLDVRAFRPSPSGRLHRLYGGGGDSGSVKYDSLEDLYEEQAASARLLREQAEANLPGAVQSYVDQVGAIQDPGYAGRQAGLAAADMAGANAMERAATERNLASMGVNPNDPRFAGSMRSTELNNAARMAAGQNIARNDASKYQLAVAQDAVGTFTGQSNSAATQMGNASSGLGSLYSTQANQQMAQDQAQSNAIGSAVGGGMMALSMFKDGGKVKGVGGLSGLKKVERHMLGGQAGSQQNRGFFQMQQIAPPPSAQAPQQPSSMMSPTTMAQTMKAGKEFKAGGGFDGMAARNTDKLGRIAGKFSDSAGNQIQSYSRGMTMSAEEANAAADAYTQAAQNASDPALAKSYADAAANIKAGAGLPSASAEGFGAANAAAAEASGASAMSGSAALSTPATAAAELGTAAGAAGAEAGGAALGSGLASTGATAAADAAIGGSITSGAGALSTGVAAGGSTALASGAATGAAGATAAGGAMAAVGAAMPWVGAAYAVGSLLDLWADGGRVGTQNKGVSEQEAAARFSDAGRKGAIQDLRPGGDVPGKWQGNTDNVPSMLTEEEFVLNAEASKAIGLGTLEKLNKKGLQMRKQGKTPDTIKTVGLGALA